MKIDRYSLFVGLMFGFSVGVGFCLFLSYLT